MKIHTYDFLTQSSYFADIYKTDKRLGRLIRSRVFTIKDGDSQLKCKITYVKPKGMDLMVNIKVCGKIKYGWSNVGPFCITSDPRHHFSDSRNRNYLIRNYFKDDIRRYFSYFGIDSYNVEIGKVKVCKEL
jgi:hypothetical protein